MTGSNPFEAPGRRALKIVGAGGRYFWVPNVRDHPIPSALAVISAHILSVLGFMGNDPKRVGRVHTVGYGFLADVVGYCRGRHWLKIDRSGVYLGNDAIAGWEG